MISAWGEEKEEELGLLEGKEKFPLMEETFVLYLRRYKYGKYHMLLFPAW